jgi:putative phage-type endonuclease
MEQGSPEWHKLRSRSVGGSDAPVLWGVSPYKNEAELLQEKLAVIAGDKLPEPTERMRRGSEAEKFIRQETYPDMKPVVKTNGRFHASLDGCDWMNTGLEVKFKSQKAWDECKDRVPIHDLIQCWHNICVSDLQGMHYLAALDEGQAIEEGMKFDSHHHFIDARDIPEGWAHQHYMLCQDFISKLDKAIADPFAMVVYSPGSEVTSSELATEAAAVLVQLKSRLDTLTETKQDFVRPAKEIITKASELFDPAIQRIKQEIDSTKKAIANFRAARAIALPQGTIAPKPAGVNTRKVSKLEITDVQAMVNWLAQDAGRLSLVEITLTKEAAASIKEGLQIPCVDLVTKETIVSR